MSSCLSGGGGGRTYRLDLDIVKSSSALSSAPARSSASSSSSSSSASSSVLSDSSNSPLLAISIKKPRAPRKRPNQTYNEAAALLSTAYPTVFLPSKALSKQPKPLLLSHSSSSSSSKFPDPSADLLPAFPVLSSDAAAFLIRRPADQKPLQPDSAEQQPTLSSPTSAVTAEFRDGGCNSPALSPAVSNEFREPPDSPAFSNDDFDTESILDEEAAEQGIDAIMGNLSMSASANSNENENENENENSHSIPSCGINPYIKSLMGFGLGSKFELGLGFTYGRSIHRALRQRDGGYRWSSPTVPVKDICSKFKAPTASSSAPPPEAKKSKKKSKKVEKKLLVDTDSPAAAAAAAAHPAATADAEQAEVGSKRVALGLKLNHDEVLKAWSDRGSMFSSDGPNSPNSSAEALVSIQISPPIIIGDRISVPD